VTAGSAARDTAAAPSRFAAVIEQPEVRTELGRRSCTEWGWGTLREIQLRALKWHRERCTFELVMETTQGRYITIAKVFDDQRSHILPTMDAIRRAGFGTEAAFAIPRPLAYFPAWRVLVEEKVPGPSARETILHGSVSERAAAAARCGQWLARFHAVAPRLGKPAAMERESTRFATWRNQIAGFGEPLAGKCELLFRRLQAAAPPLSPVDARAGHGSYIPEHVILSDRRTVTIDLDECDVADPSRDVAWFVVSVQRLALTQLGSLQARDDVVGSFLRAYEASSGPGAAVHVPFYRMLECLHRARRDLVKRAPPVAAWAEIMLDEGLRLAPRPQVEPDARAPRAVPEPAAPECPPAPGRA